MERLVVIVDDDPSIRRSTCRLIAALGHRVEAFGSAEEFLDSGRAAQTACLILDVRMPGLDGLALQHRLATQGLRVPIVFITALASEDEESRALDGGAVAFLRKPVDKSSLVRVLDAVLEPSGHGGGPR
jgi:FixJ family two-component response regulator